MNAQELSTVAELIAAVGTEQLGASLCSLVSEDVHFDMSCAYLFRFDQPAVLLHDGYAGMVPAATMEAYVCGGYLLDPYYVACMNQHPAGVWRMSDLAPDCFFASGFAISRDLHPCVSSSHGSQIEELGFIIPLQAGNAIVFSLMRAQENGAFSAGEINRLQALAPLVNSTFVAHWRMRAEEVVASGDAGRQLENAFVDILQGQLTDAQRYIAKLVLQGHSNASIAHALGISEGTVKVHKHNIYQRLEISSNSDLFRLFIEHISRTTKMAG